MNLIKNAKDAYEKLSSSEFEDYIASVFEMEGGFSIQTKKTRDGGYDICLVKDQISYLVEVKKQNIKQKVGRPFLQKLVGANANINADRLIFVTTGYFTKDAIEYAQKNNIILYDKESVDEMIRFYNENIFEPDFVN